MGLCMQCIFLFDCINISFGILEVWVVVAVGGGLCMQCIFLFDCINITFGILEVWLVVAVGGGGG